MKNFLGEIRFSRFTRSRGDGGINLEILDRETGAGVLTAEISFDQFVLCITGQQGKMKDAQISADLIGTIDEHEKRNIFVPAGALTARYDERDKRKLEAEIVLFDHEKDGWKGDWDNLYNHHHHVSSGAEGSIYNVHFRRTVSVEHLSRCGECQFRGKHDHSCSQHEIMRPSTRRKTRKIRGE